MSTWIDNWAKIPESPSGKENGRTHGVCVCKNGNVIVFHQAENALVTYDAEGSLISAVGGDRWLGAHGLTKIEENGEEFLWLTDQNTGEIAKVTLAGETVMTLAKPDLKVYNPGRYAPTWAAQNPLNGEIWTADGYGAYQVHHYSAEGEYMDSLLGSAQEGAFREPHGINFRLNAAGEAELFVTDRAKHLIQVFDGAGNFLRSGRSNHSPCCFDFYGDEVLVPELFTGVNVLDADSLELKEEFGASDRVGPNPDGGWWPPAVPEGWPNLAGTEHVRSGFFNSPHGGCFDADGNLFVVEWIIGGRITKILRQG